MLLHLLRFPFALKADSPKLYSTMEFVIFGEESRGYETDALTYGAAVAKMLEPLALSYLDTLADYSHRGDESDNLRLLRAPS